MIALPKPKRNVKSKKKQLTVLSFGGGQDSTAILYLLANVSEFREHYAPGDLLVVMADTGDEFPKTYLHVLLVQQFCKDKGIEFVHIKPEMGYHSKNWQSLTGYFETYNVVMSKFFVKSCTDQLKIQPIYRFLNQWIADKYGYEAEGGKYRGKRALVEFSQEHGKVRMLIGIAKGEESRVTTDEDSPTQWMRLSVAREFPLIKLGWDRQACQNYIRSLGKTVPPPSNCMRCPFMDQVELLYLARKFPPQFEEWVEYERRKLKKFAHLGESNYGVLHKTKTLREMLADAEKKHGHLTLEQLEGHRFSHGHCVRSKY